MGQFAPSTRPSIPLTDTVKSQIRALLTSGVPQENIAEMYNCSEGQVRGIWSHMVRTKNSTKTKKKTTSRKPRPVTRPSVPSEVFHRAPNNSIVRIDASNFDEVIVVNGDSEIRVQISS